jgi:hypothetical protein
MGGHGMKLHDVDVHNVGVYTVQLEHVHCAVKV